MTFAELQKRCGSEEQCIQWSGADPDSGLKAFR